MISERFRIRDVIVTDVVALKKWSVVLDHLLSSEVDIVRIKDMLEKNRYAEAVLETLQFTNCDLDHVLEVLRSQRLNSLAGSNTTCEFHVGSTFVRIDLESSLLYCAHRKNRHGHRRPSSVRIPFESNLVQNRRVTARFRG